VIPALRNAYPSLTYHYWRACAQARDTQGISQIADQITGHLEAWGALPPVSSVYGWIKQDALAHPVWLVRLRRALELLDKIANDPLLPPGAAGLIRGIIELVERITTDYNQ
jgi:hypothetical protein